MLFDAVVSCSHYFLMMNDVHTNYVEIECKGEGRFKEVASLKTVPVGQVLRIYYLMFSLERFLVLSRVDNFIMGKKSDVPFTLHCLHNVFFSEVVFFFYFTVDFP